MVVGHQTAVRQAQREVPLYSVQAQAVAVDVEAVMLVGMVELGANGRQGAVVIMVGLRMLEIPVSLGVVTVAGVQTVSKLVQAGMEEPLVGVAEVAEVHPAMVLEVPMAVRVEKVK